jgi:hypothetical protein
MLSGGVGAYLSRLWIQAQVLERLGGRGVPDQS